MTDVIEDFDFRIPGDYSKARAIRYVISEMDRLYTERSASALQIDRDKVDEDPDVRTDTSIGISSDEGSSDSEPRSETRDNGERTSQAKPSGESTDEGASDEADRVEESSSGLDEQPTSVERVDEAVNDSEGEHAFAHFHFAPGQHSRGN